MKKIRLPEKFVEFFKKYKWGILTWVLIIVLVQLGLYFKLDKGFLTVVVLILGIAGQAFAVLISWFGLIPIVGPILVQVLSLPIVWLINGIGYLASVLAIKKGHTPTVVNFRIITITFLVGITFGYILGKIL